MTRPDHRIRAVLLAALMILSVVAGSVAFAGSTAAVTGSSVVQSIDPNTPDEDSTVTFSFNYSFSGVDTGGDTTLTLSAPSDVAIQSTTARMENASGAEIDTATVDGNANSITVTATPSTSTVYLNGTVTAETPTVNSDDGRTIDVTADDNDVTTETVSETITVQDRSLTVSDVSAFSPTSADEETTKQYAFNYSFTGVDTSGDTTLSLSTPGDLVISSTNVEMKSADGSQLAQNGSTSDIQTISVTATPSTETVYLDGSAKITTPSVDGDTNEDVDIAADDNDGDTVETTATLTVRNTPVEVVSSPGIGFNPTRVDEQTTNQHNFNYTFNNVSVQSTTTFSVTGPSGSTITAADLAVQNASGDDIATSPSINNNKLTITADSSTSTAYLAGSFNLTSPEVPEGQEQKTYDIDIESSDNGGSGSITEQLTVDFVGGQSGDPELESAIQYDDSGTPTVEVAFSEDVQNFASNYNLYVDGEGQLSGGQVQPSEAQGRATIQLDQSYSSAMTLELQSGITDPDGNALVSDDTGNTSVRFAPTSVTAGGSVNAYQGANVSIVASTTETGVEINGVDDGNNYFFDGSTDTNSRVFVFATADRDAGDYEADISGEGTADITVRDLRFSLDIDDRNVTNLQSIEGTVSAAAGNRPVELELLDDDGEVIDDRTVDLSGQGNHEFGYDAEALDLDTGDYTIRATDTTSGVTIESDTIVVRDAGDVKATLSGSIITETRGDVAAVEIEFDNTDEATLTVGGDNVGFEANITVRDDDNDDRATVYFDSYAASTVSEGSFDGDNDLFSVSDDDEAVGGSVNIGVSDLLDAESYDLSVATEGRETDVQLLVLEPRETTAIRTLTAPRNRYGDLDAAADVREGSGEWLTATGEVAVGDTVVYEIEASGLEGVLDARGEDTVTEEFYDFANGSGSSPAANFVVEQGDPGPNQNPLVLRLNGSNSKVVADSENDTYYVATRTGANAPGAVEDDDEDGVVDPGETDYGEISNDDDLRAEFTVYGDDENDLDLTEGGDDETVETTHGLTPAELSMSEPFNVTEVSGQDVFGEATVAPGTEIRVRVRSGDGVRPPFLKTAETTVGTDGQFLVTFSFNDTSPGDRYNVIVDDTGPASEISVEGTVQPVIATATTDTPAETTVITSTPEPTTTTATATTAPATTTTAPATTTTEVPTVRTPTTTPGFGVVAAVVALAAAALLAVRRKSRE